MASAVETRVVVAEAIERDKDYVMFRLLGFLIRWIGNGDDFNGRLRDDGRREEQHAAAQVGTCWGAGTAA